MTTRNDYAQVNGTQTAPVNAAQPSFSHATYRALLGAPFAEHAHAPWAAMKEMLPD